MTGHPILQIFYVYILYAVNDVYLLFFRHHYVGILYLLTRIYLAIFIDRSLVSRWW